MAPPLGRSGDSIHCRLPGLIVGCGWLVCSLQVSYDELAAIWEEFAGQPPPQRVKWKPPRGVGWGDLPKGTRIQLAGGEYVEAKLALEGRLRAQLDALADHRPLAYEARLSALYAIDPMSALSEARTVRQGATSIEERLRRELRASASAPEL